MDNVLTVYLDQMKWIDLARAETGHPDGAAYVETLAILKQAADEGRARFPLGTIHYFETAKQRDRKKRMELAATMVRLAGPLRIAPAQAIVPWEIRRALVDVFDLPTVIPALEVFGPGVAHAFAAPAMRYTAATEWQGIPLAPEFLPELQRRGSLAWEALLLAFVAATDGPEATRLALNKFKRATDERFVQGQLEVAAAVKEHGRHQLERIMLATAYTDIREPLGLGAMELGVSPEDLAPKFQAVLEAMPSRWVEMKLRHQRQANPQKAWQGNDLNDVIALSDAVPYCDVVVTETSWSSMLGAAKVPQRLGTIVTANLHDVVDLLDADA